MNKKWMNPLISSQMSGLLKSANRIMGRSEPQKDFGSNQERQQILSENDHIYKKSVKNLLEQGRIEMMPRKAGKFLNWLEENHNDFFLSLDVDDSKDIVEILYLH